MNRSELKETAKALVAGDKGLLAMDESTGTCNKRFAKLGIPQTEGYRHAYRDLIITTPGLGDSISGAILFDETIRQVTKDGVPFVEQVKKAGIIPGIKLDEGAVDMAGFPGEKITEGMDGLKARVDEYVKMGARFAKWRAVITIGDGTPTTGSIGANALILARYAAICQEGGLVPIVEPEVLMDGNHSLEACAKATTEVLHIVFDTLFHQRVMLEGMLLKPNMVLPGLDSPVQQNIDEVSDLTVEVLRATVPATVPGVVFLSGGQSPELATARLNSMNLHHKSELPWPLTFSYSRAIQQPALDLWKGDDANTAAAQKALAYRAHLNTVARRGEYNSSLESGGDK